MEALSPCVEAPYCPISEAESIGGSVEGGLGLAEGLRCWAAELSGAKLATSAICSSKIHVFHIQISKGSLLNK